jgi:hypothetical protein
MTIRNTVLSSIRKLAGLAGVGIAGVAIGAGGAPNELFACQFLSEGTRVELPKMVYDPKLQMMVDAATRQPVYSDAKKLAVALPTVTAGCSDCPKADD